MRRYARDIGLIIASILALCLASCAQDAKITAPRYALVYGVSTYQSMYEEAIYYATNNIPDPSYFVNLSYSDDDAASMAALMQNRGWTVVSRVKGSAGNTTGPTTQGPSKVNMIADLQSLAAKIDSSSTVFLYFSGHGTLDDNGVPYIVPYEGVADSPEYQLSFSDCVSPADLNSMLAILPTKNIIVIFDTCFSGGFVSAGSSIDSSPQNFSNMPGYSAFSTAQNYFGQLLSANASASGSKAPIVLSAAGSVESSYDGPVSMAHGVFTYYLLQAATQADGNGDGVVTTTEAYEYTSEKIKSWGESQVAQNYPDGLPFLPHLSGGVRDLVLF